MPVPEELTSPKYSDTIYVNSYTKAPWGEVES